jgi:hypothetical protein
LGAARQEVFPLLTRNHRQEALSRAYVQAIAARCGLACSLRDFDYGIDLTLHDIRRKGGRCMESGFKLDIQAKSIAGGAVTETHIPYDLRAAAYDGLRDPHVGCPRILVLLVMPADEATWTGQSEEHLLLRHCAYWLSLRGQKATPNQQTVRLAIPRTNVFSVEALEVLMAKVRKREPL